MVMTPTTMLSLGTSAPDFRLPDTRGEIVSLADFKAAPGLLVMFLCNHCPYVQHIRVELARFASDAVQRALGVVAINSNDVSSYPEDSPDKMAEWARRDEYRFPYLFDATQKVAQAYRASCTPDFFLFDRQQRLVYRGQFDASRPGNDIPVTGSDLRAAVDAVLTGRPVPADQKPSIGCNIKWKPGNAPDYFQR